MTNNVPAPALSVVFVDRDSETYLMEGVKKNGWHVIAFKGGGSLESFFSAARYSLPLDYPISGKVSWDALDDSLSGGLIDINAECAIVWADADELLQKDPKAFGMCVQFWSDVEYGLELQRRDRRTNAALRSFLLGKGPQFLGLDTADLVRRQTGPSGQ